MNQRLFIPGPLPGLNDYLGTGDWRRYTAHKKRWGKLIAARIVQAKLAPMRNARIAWVWHEKNRRRDPDNIAGIGKKFVLDALVSCGILPDDGWDELLGWSDSWIIDKTGPGVTVVLEGLRLNNGQHMEDK